MIYTASDHCEPKNVEIKRKPDIKALFINIIFQANEWIDLLHPTWLQSSLTIGTLDVSYSTAELFINSDSTSRLTKVEAERRKRTKRQIILILIRIRVFDESTRNIFRVT